MLKITSCLIIVLTISVLTISFGQYLMPGQDNNNRLAPRLLNYQGYLTDTLVIRSPILRFP